MAMNRVASIDAVVAAGADVFGPRPDAERPQRVRTLSFNPFPPDWDFSFGASPRALEGVAAYEVSRWKRICKSIFLLIFDISKGH